MFVKGKMISALATAVTLVVAAGVVFGFSPAPGGGFYVRLQERVMSDVRNVQNRPGQVEKMLTRLFIDFPAVTSVMRRNANLGDPVQYDYFLNNVALFEAQTNRASRQKILRDIKGNMNRFIYSGDVSAVSAWNLTH